MTTQAIEKHMTVYPTTTTRSVTVSEALALMDKGHYRHLPVVEDKKIIGIVSQRDLLKMEPFMDSLEPLIEDVMIRNPYVVPLGTSLVTVAKTMARQKYGSAVVINDLHEVVGIFTTTDALTLLGMMLSGVEIPRLNEYTIEDFFSWGEA